MHLESTCSYFVKIVMIWYYKNFAGVLSNVTQIELCMVCVITGYKNFFRIK